MRPTRPSHSRTSPSGVLSEHPVPQRVPTLHRSARASPSSSGSASCRSGSAGSASAGTDGRPAEPTHRARRRCHPRRAPRLSGRVPARAQRPVELQRRTPERWVRVDRRARTAGGLRLRPPIRAPPTTYRVVAERSPRPWGASPRTAPGHHACPVGRPRTSRGRRPRRRCFVARRLLAGTPRTPRPSRARREDGWNASPAGRSPPRARSPSPCPRAAEGPRPTGWWASWEERDVPPATRRRCRSRIPSDTTPAPVRPGCRPRRVTAPWADLGPRSSDDDLAGYRVYSAASETGPWTEVTDAPEQGRRTSTVDGLTNDVPVRAGVTSLDSSGNEFGRSTPVSVTPVDDVPSRRTAGPRTHPSPPVSAAPTLPWAPVTDGGLAGYRVYTAASATGLLDELTDEPTSRTTWTAPTLGYGHAVLFAVTAEDPPATSRRGPRDRDRGPGPDDPRIGHAPGSTQHSARRPPRSATTGAWSSYHSTSPTSCPATPTGRDVFFWDRTTGSSRLVAAAGIPANQRLPAPHISGDGRWVTYASRARNLVTGGPTAATSSSGTARPAPRSGSP